MRRALIVVLAVGALGVAACGGDDAMTCDDIDAAMDRLQTDATVTVQDVREDLFDGHDSAEVEDLLVSCPLG